MNGKLKSTLLVFTAASGANVLFSSVTAQTPLQQSDPAGAPQGVTWSECAIRRSGESVGDGTAVIAGAGRARLHCVSQRLHGEAAAEGLWLTSTATHASNDHFRVRSVSIGAQSLPETGSVSVAGQTVRWCRAGLTEEYSASLDGVRQDFIVERAPETARAVQPHQLVLSLSVTGARVEPAGDSVLLVLDDSGRRIAYSRLRATDATGKELPARMEVELQKLAVVVNDAGAMYPIRIDPTFSDANWVSMGGGLPGVNGYVFAMVLDGSGNLYIGGQFTIVGNTIATNIARWDGTNWSALGPGIGGYYYVGDYDPGSVNALAVSGSRLYVGGNFVSVGGKQVNYIAQWDGTNWSALGTGFNQGVAALAVMGGRLYAAGDFWMAGTNELNDLAQWDGTNWSALGSGVGGYGSWVGSLAVSGSTLYVGGYFTSAGGIAATNIAQWNGNSWAALGPGLDYVVDVLAASGDTLYAGGEFRYAGTTMVNSIARWNGSSWSALGSGMGGPASDNYVYALAVSGNTLYAGGHFATAGGLATTNLAQWDGSHWSTLGAGMNYYSDYVVAFAVSGNTLYAGGSFSSAGGITADSIAQWDGSNWSPLRSALWWGLNGTVDALAVSEGIVYAGGTFTGAGNIVLNYIAQWNGSNWLALGSGLNGQVNALAASGSTLYAGGNFTAAGTNAVNYIAQWNGSDWSSLGQGLSGAVDALAVSGSTLYVGGSFTDAGGAPANYVAQWNGSTWSALGSGMNSSVNSLLASRNTLYVGGTFTTAGGKSANCIAQWDGSSWSALGGGMNGGVTALVMLGGTLYAGGAFTTADGILAGYIAQWNGRNWAAVYPGWYVLGGYVSALAVSGGTLYVGGYFTGPYLFANYIAQWNGNAWATLGSGVEGPVYALAASGNTFYVGGSFLTAGGKVSAYCAQANLPLNIGIITRGTGFGFTNGKFGFNLYGPTGCNAVVQASSDLRIWVPLQTNSFGNDWLYFSDPQAAAIPNRFYRALLSP